MEPLSDLETTASDFQPQSAIDAPGQNANAFTPAADQTLLREFIQGNWIKEAADNWPLNEASWLLPGIFFAVSPETNVSITPSKSEDGICFSIQNAEKARWLSLQFNLQLPGFASRNCVAYSMSCCASKRVIIKPSIRLYPQKDVFDEFFHHSMIIHNDDAPFGDVLHGDAAAAPPMMARFLIHLHAGSYELSFNRLLIW